MSPVRVERADVWDLFRALPRGALEVYAVVLPEQVTESELDEREGIVRCVEQLFVVVPQLRWYARIGMYDFAGMTASEQCDIVDWIVRCGDRQVTTPPIRWGLAPAREDGLRTIEHLMGGTAEAARSDARANVFAMGEDHWVRPIDTLTRDT